jgi:CDP-diacylglycerol---serine O-phosphatidyltransferase
MIHTLKYIVPNACTALSMLCGFASVILSTQDMFEWAAWCITWGVLLDKLDGTFARLLNASSDFGVQFDSFADFIIFGMAPASLFYFVCQPLVEQGWSAYTIFAISGFYFVMTACRLAKFNISTPPNGDKVFYGLPTTLSGAILSTGYLTWISYYGAELSIQNMQYMLGFLLLFALLMISPLILPKLKMRGIWWVDTFQIVNVAAAYILAPLKLYPEYLLFLCVFYVVVGFTVGFIGAKKLPPAINTPHPSI